MSSYCWCRSVVNRALHRSIGLIEVGHSRHCRFVSEAWLRDVHGGGRKLGVTSIGCSSTDRATGGHTRHSKCHLVYLADVLDRRMEASYWHRRGLLEAESRFGLRQLFNRLLSESV